MVRQWQTLFFDGHYSNTNLKPGDKYLPDFVGLAESMGCAAIRVTRKENVRRRDRQGPGDQRPPGRHRLHRR
jgi:acetolactate synthase-1/2/3 large subunit